MGGDQLSGFLPLKHAVATLYLKSCLRDFVTLVSSGGVGHGRGHNQGEHHWKAVEQEGFVTHTQGGTQRKGCSDLLNPESMAS